MTDASTAVRTVDGKTVPAPGTYQIDYIEFPSTSGVRTREFFGVPRDPNRSLRDFNTLHRVIDHIVEFRDAPRLASIPHALKSRGSHGN